MAPLPPRLPVTNHVPFYKSGSLKERWANEDKDAAKKQEAVTGKVKFKLSVGDITEVIAECGGSHCRVGDTQPGKLQEGGCTDRNEGKGEGTPAETSSQKLCYTA